MGDHWVLVCTQVEQQGANCDAPVAVRYEQCRIDGRPSISSGGYAGFRAVLIPGRLPYRCLPADLAERKGQQARAQQHQAGRGQCEESVGDQIVVAHDTPATLEARPNFLKLSESPAAKEVMRLSTRGRSRGRDLKLRPGNDSLQTHGPGKSPRSPSPLPL
jgi:hypothetical protein